jgi:predicted amidohydrolase
MLSKKIVLAAAIVLSAALPASAATKHHRVTHVHSAIYNMVVPAAVGGGGCPANGGPGCSNAGPAPPDGW